MSPTGRTAGLVAACALLAFVLPTAVVTALVVLVLVASGLDARRVREAPEVVRQVPLLLSRGVPDVLRLSVSDPTAQVAQPAPAGLAVGPLRPIGVGGYEAQLLAARRGRHALPPAVVRRVGPRGLGAWTHHVGGSAPVTVYPDLPAARRLARPRRVSVATLPGQSLRGPLGLGTDFEALRDYLPDDDVRMVNWRATARLDRPMSNTYRVEQARRVLLAVDCGRLMAAPLAGGVSRLDAAVDAAAAVALAADAAADRVGLVAFDDAVRASVRPSVGGGAGVLRALAELEPRTVESDVELLLSGLPRGHRAAVLVFTDLLDEAGSRALVELLPAVAARHSVAVVSALDDELEAVLRTEPVDAASAALLSAAADLVEARLRARTLLRRAGARVVEARAGRLAAGAVAAYLGPR